MIKNKYRLDNYIITEYDNHFYTWETNIVLGEHRTGNCFVVGEILIINSSGHKKNGCLKLEYSEKLARLPFWSKTDYYCFSDSLKDVKKEATLSNYLDQKTVEKYFCNVKRPLIKGEYRLGLYKIIVNSEQAIFWEKYDGLNINKGACIIKSELLFVQSKFDSNDSILSRREWFHKLKSLPKWEVTSAWGRLEVLKICYKNKKVKNLSHRLPSLDNLTPRSVNPIPHLYQYTEKRERFSHLLFNILERIVQSWRYLIGKKAILVRVIPRLKDVSYIAVKFMSVLFEKTFHYIRELCMYLLTRFRK